MQTSDAIFKIVSQSNKFLLDRLILQAPIIRAGAKVELSKGSGVDDLHTIGKSCGLTLFPAIKCLTVCRSEHVWKDWLAVSLHSRSQKGQLMINSLPFWICGFTGHTLVLHWPRNGRADHLLFILLTGWEVRGWAAGVPGVYVGRRAEEVAVTQPIKSCPQKELETRRSCLFGHGVPWGYIISSSFTLTAMGWWHGQCVDLTCSLYGAQLSKFTGQLITTAMWGFILQCNCVPMSPGWAGRCTLMCLSTVFWCFFPCSFRRFTVNHFPLSTSN